jgi:hypothetical protein
MQNQLTGTIPFLGSLTALTDLNIRDNKVWFGAKYFDVSHKNTLRTYINHFPFEQMTGDIPNEIYSLTALQSLNLGNDITRGNAFRRTLPSNFLFPNLGPSHRILANKCHSETSPTSCSFSYRRTAVA